jgi:mannan endo-1,4-beta-mannosidase
MKSRLVMFVAICLAAAALGAAAGRLIGLAPFGPPTVHATLAPELASYLGTFEPGAPPDYAPVAGFAKAAGRQPNLVGYYSGWAQPFNMAFAQMIRKHGVIPFVQIDPTDASVSAIAAGTYDEYLHTYADRVRDFGHAVVIGFGHEMNAPWYSWGYGHTSPGTFVAAWRHIVTLFRDQGAQNVTWLWTLQADEPGTGPIHYWWPGAGYVTWVGIDGYYYRPGESFSGIFGPTIAQVRMFTGRPVLLSETAVGPRAGQAAKIPGLFAGMREYGALGLVWFDIVQHDGIYHQDWHVEDDPAAATAFRHAAAALTLARP